MMAGPDLVAFAPRLEPGLGLGALRGALSADTGRGSGEWISGDKCQGAFELARVE